MANLKNDRLIKACRCEPVDSMPVWLMRQAGRYLPEYRQLRVQATDFMKFCKTPALAAEATMQPLARYDLDAAIVFSDILTVPDAMGLPVEFQTGHGPVFKERVIHEEDVARLQVNVNDRLDYVYETVDRVVTQLNGQVPLIGFAGSPFTVACYMIEGQGSKTFYQTRQALYRQPGMLRKLLEALAKVTTQHCLAQIKAGADVIMLFDSWGGVLTPDTYQQFSLTYMDDIAAQLKASHPDVPIIFFTKGGGLWLEQIADTHCDVIGLDWTINIAHARKRVGGEVALQGNLDPAVLLSNAEQVRRAVATIVQRCANQPGHIFNLGHGIDKETSPELVTVMIDELRKTQMKTT